jgi:hypothetical protein
MQIRNSETVTSRAWGRAAVLMPVLLAWVAFISGCGKDPALKSIETDAHGYLCLKCGVKFYTGAREFLEPQCPKCRQPTLEDVIGYWCEKDKHLTIRPKVSRSAVCEKCGDPLKNAMVSPREKDLLAWGATKTSPQEAH